MQRKPRPAVLFINRRCAGSPAAIQTMASENEFTSVLTGAPSPRPLGMSAAAMVKVLPEAASTITASVVLHSMVWSSASPSLKVSVARSSACPVRARIQPLRDRITVSGSSTTVRSICARSAVLISVLRSSPYFFASSASSFTTSFLSSLSSPSRLLSSLRSDSRALRSSFSLIPSSLVSCPSRRLTMSSACLSVNLYFFWRLRRASAWSSLARISLMISSILAYASSRPSTISMRSWTRSRRNCVRRRTVATRNSPHSRSTSTMPLVSGSPSRPSQVRFNA